MHNRLVSIQGVSVRLVPYSMKDANVGLENHEAPLCDFCRVEIVNVNDMANPIFIGFIMERNTNFQISNGHGFFRKDHEFPLHMEMDDALETMINHVRESVRQMFDMLGC